MKYKGPCIDCGEYKDQQYILKRCIACYQKYHRYNKNFEPRKRYEGPCVVCGTYESTNGRFIRKMCSKCYGRYKIDGDPNYKEIEKYQGPCVVCGTYEPGYYKYFQKKMCSKCYRHHIYRKDKPKPEPKHCIDCGDNLKQWAKSNRCRSCRNKFYRKNNPDFYAKEKARIRRYNKTKKGREVSRNRVRNRRAKLAQVKNTLTAREWQEVLKQYDCKCVYCGSSKNIEMDHIIPISKNGPHTKNNVIPACRRCNSKKSNKAPLVSIQPVLI